MTVITKQKISADYEIVLTDCEDIEWLESAKQRFTVTIHRFSPRVAGALIDFIEVYHWSAFPTIAEATIYFNWLLQLTECVALGEGTILFPVPCLKRRKN